MGFLLALIGLIATCDAFEAETFQLRQQYQVAVGIMLVLIGTIVYLLDGDP